MAEVIQKDLQEQLRRAFQNLRDEVVLEVFTEKTGENEEFAQFTRGLATEIAELSPKITARLYDLSDPKAKERKVDRSPTLLISPDRFKIRYTGAPAGEEVRSFLQAIFMASGQGMVLSDWAVKRLGELKERRNVKVFVSPT